MLAVSVQHIGGNGTGELRSLALTLHAELAPEGIHAATVTIAGQIQPGTVLTPERIADALWALNADQPGQFRAEIIFKGTLDQLSYG